MAEQDYFLKIDSIPGEALDAKHAGEIQLLSFRFGETNNGSFSQSSGGGSGKVSMQDFHFTMYSNIASPKLFQACATGQHIPSAVLTLRKGTASGPVEYLVYKFTDLLISSYQTAGPSSDNPIPTDEISFNFSSIVVDYKQQNADGSLGAPVHGGWDVKLNQKK